MIYFQANRQNFLSNIFIRTEKAELLPFSFLVQFLKEQIIHLNAEVFEIGWCLLVYHHLRFYEL